METTINIHVELLDRITREARNRKISRSKMIVALLEMMMEDRSQPPRFGRPVQYQAKKKPEEWRNFHITLMEDQYEYFQDLRKLFKMSVSLIIAIAARDYLENPQVKIITDNYLFNSYLVVREIVDSVICWRLYWGYPTSIMEQMKKLNR